MRLQVFLSHSGACSRRKALELVQKGLVTVNGQVVTEASFPVDDNRDEVYLSGERIRLKNYTYIILYKPKGVTATCQDKYARMTVLDLLPGKYRHLYPVGRLDKDTEGLLIMTNDGDLSFRLLHPKFKVDKVYNVRIDKKLTQDHKTILERGIFIDGKRTFPCKIRVMHQPKTKNTIRMVLYEGRKRQIKLMFSALRYKVTYLKRISEGPIVLGGLKCGKWRLLTEKEIKDLRQSTGLA